MNMKVPGGGGKTFFSKIGEKLKTSKKKTSVTEQKTKNLSKVNLENQNFTENKLYKGPELKEKVSQEGSPKKTQAKTRKTFGQILKNIGHKLSPPFEKLKFENPIRKIKAARAEKRELKEQAKINGENQKFVEDFDKEFGKIQDSEGRTFSSLISSAKENPLETGKIIKSFISESGKFPTNQDKVPVAKYFLLNLPDKATQLKFIEGMISKNIEEAPEGDPGAILRGDNIETAVLREYLNTNFLPLAKNSSVLKEALNQLPKENLVQWEGNEKVISNLEGTKEAVSLIFNEMKNILIYNQDKPEIRGFFDLMNSNKNQINEKFESPKGEITAMNHLFLRFFCPMIMGAEDKRIVNYEEDQQKNGILISKVIQNFINQIRFGTKEQAMLVFNDTLEQLDIKPLEDLIFKD